MLSSLALAAAFHASSPSVPAGDSTTVDLAQLVLAPDAYQGQDVAVTGTVDVLVFRRLWVLHDGDARALLIPSFSLDAGALDGLVGFRAEVKGIARTLRPYDEALDKERFPDLPRLPRPLEGWPQATVTVQDASRAEGVPAGEARAVPPAGTVASILHDPAAYATQSVRIVGLFRGRNLFGELPAGSQRDPADWVLREGASALWITGKAPRGKGWSLDPEYKGDATRWLEVEGRVEVVNGVAYLRANKVVLVRKPDDAAGGPR
jgi:hypothetical protein